MGRDLGGLMQLSRMVMKVICLTQWKGIDQTPKTPRYHEQGYSYLDSHILLNEGQLYWHGGWKEKEIHE